jgi:ribosomal protein S18 acetylase RimI-like enzyme
MEIRHATPQDLHEVMGLIRSCVSHMESQGIHQWDAIYPDEAILEKDIERHELFLLEKDDHICGIMALNELQDPEYQAVQWQLSGKALVVHRLAIAPSSQGKGFARKLMQFAYDFAKERQYATIRLDAFAYNPSAVSLYKRLGYQKVGTVVFRKGPFFCFEIQVDAEKKLEQTVGT